MSDGTTTPANWYPDPEDPARMRWWDGFTWTHHVRVPEPTQLPQEPYVPFGGYVGLAVPGRPLPPLPINTVWVWLIAFSPIWTTMVSAAVYLWIATDDSTGRVVSGLVAIAALIAFAIFDHNRLRAGGHPRAASAGWMLLTPIAYLIVRRITVKRYTGRGSAPGNVYALFFLIPLAAGILIVVAGTAATLGR